jgi:hypothetical protein
MGKSHQARCQFNMTKILVSHERCLLAKRKGDIDVSWALAFALGAWQWPGLGDNSFAILVIVLC